MFLEFSVNNFKSIKNTATFSMNVATKDHGNCSSIRDYNILTSSVIYGANATGKSNLLKAMIFMRNMVLNKYKITQSTDNLKHYPYKLSTETENTSTSFEIVFFINATKYRYGFESDERVVYSEWLFEDTKGKEAKLFYRDLSEELLYINKNRFKEGINLKAIDNKLFIWKCDQEGGEISSSILKWFTNFNLIDGSKNGGYINFTLNKMRTDSFKEKMTSLLKVADLGIEGILTEEEHLDERALEKLSLPPDVVEKIIESKKIKSIKIRSQHKKFNSSLDDYELVDFDFRNEESVGTSQFFFIAAPILDTIEKGGVLLIDEFGASLHPMLTRYIVKMFNDKNINKNQAQLIFVTHDTNMLDNSILRRDQIWFAEKDYYGSTHIYSLSDYKNVRPKENFEKNYLQGKYGAIPFLGKFHFEGRNDV